MARLHLPTLHTRVAFCDPAAGKSGPLKKIRARSAIVVIAQDDLSRIFVLAAWADRCPTDALTDKIFELNDRWRPRIFGIEANAMQTLYGDMVSREAKFRARRVPITGVKQPTNVNKVWRIRTALQQARADGRIFWHPRMVELEAEAHTFPQSPTLDLVDALASAVTLLPTVHTRIERDTELERRLAYLRDTGAAPSYIERVARGAA